MDERIKGIQYKGTSNNLQAFPGAHAVKVPRSLAKSRLSSLIREARKLHRIKRKYPQKASFPSMCSLTPDVPYIKDVANFYGLLIIGQTDSPTGFYVGYPEWNSGCVGLHLFNLTPGSYYILNYQIQTFYQYGNTADEYKFEAYITGRGFFDIPAYYHYRHNVITQVPVTFQAEREEEEVWFKGLFNSWYVLQVDIITVPE